MSSITPSGHVDPSSQQTHSQQRSSRSTKPDQDVADRADTGSADAGGGEDNIQTSYSWTINGRRMRAPKLIRVLFDTFPLYTYPSEKLPSNTTTTISQPNSNDIPQLYTFTTPADAQTGAPSYNPTCLKWQTYLKMRNIKCQIVVSSNHASPSGSLPFLAVKSAQNPNRTTLEVIPTSGIPKWVQRSSGSGASKADVDLESLDVRAFMSLLETKIKYAWLYSTYIQSNNFTSITRHNYTQSVSTWPIYLVLGREMQSAAEVEILRGCGGNLIRPNELFDDAQNAFQALSTLLGQQHWFFDGSKPGMFDAAVFSYTHLLLDLPFHSQESQLKSIVANYDNLIAHRDRILSQYY